MALLASLVANCVLCICGYVLLFQLSTLDPAFLFSDQSVFPLECTKLIGNAEIADDASAARAAGDTG